jgi:ribonuclease-3
LADLTTLQKAMGVSFNDPSLLEQALVHSSYINENPDFALTSNERLEFLGDAILGFIVAEELYRRFTQLSEGEMTKMRSFLVQRDTLSRIAKNISLGDYLYLGKGEEASGGRRKPANLAGALEAIIAAIFLDQGLAAIRDFVLRSVNQELNKLLTQGVGVDYKSQLQEIIQARKQQTPSYKVIKTVGPDHNKTFIVEVRVGDTVLGSGSGKSKKEAEAEAARSALARLPINFTQ